MIPANDMIYTWRIRAICGEALSEGNSRLVCGDNCLLL